MAASARSSNHSSAIRRDLSWLAAATAVGLIVVLTGCSAPAGSTRRSASASSAAAPLQPSSGATSFDAEAAVSGYESALDDLYLNPDAPLDSFHAVAVTPDFLTETAAVALFRQKHFQQDGRRTVVRAAVVGSGSSDQSPSVADSVVVVSCIDVRGVRGTDPAGASIVAPDRQPYLMARMTFVPSGSGAGTAAWRVSEVTNAQAASCSG